MAKNTIRNNAKSNATHGHSTVRDTRLGSQKTYKNVASSSLAKRSATVRTKKIISDNAKRHSAALIRLADR